MDITWLEEQQYNDIKIRPFPGDSKKLMTRGIFIYQIRGRSNDERQFFENALANMIKFLNYLTYHRRHGFREMNYFYDDKPISDEKLFDIKNLPSIRGRVVDSQGELYMDISSDVQRSLNEVENIQLPLPLQKKIDTALFLYRKAFFQNTEEMRFTLQFIALEALVKKSDTKFDKKLLEDIKEAVNNICSRRNVHPESLQKIRSRIGRLSDESIRGMMRNTLQKYNIDISEGNKKIDIGEMYDARCKFVHEGEEIKNCHRLCMKMEKIIPALVEKIITNNNYNK
jgi:hypothetical protein